MGKIRWDRVARTMAENYHLDRVMALQKRKVLLRFLRSRCRPGRDELILKTDLFEEALGADEIFLTWPGPESGAVLYGLDISPRICTGADRRLAEAGRNVFVSTADARRLPFGEGAFDLVFSCSTLDHFTDRSDLVRGIEEAARVLKQGGELVLVLDNPEALFYPLVRWLDRRGRIAFLLGETLPAAELEELLPRLGFRILDGRAVYHVPRVLFTGLLKILRALRIGFLDPLLFRLLDLLEKGEGRRGQHRTGWYTAFHLRKNG